MQQQGPVQEQEIPCFAHKLTLPADICARWSYDERTVMSAGDPVEAT